MLSVVEAKNWIGDLEATVVYDMCENCKLAMERYNMEKNVIIE